MEATGFERDIPKEITLEMLLCTRYGWQQHPYYEKNENCLLCLQPMKGLYALEPPCGCIMHLECHMATMIQYKHNEKCVMCHKRFDMIM
jgi:hypothetical protein